MAIDTSKIKKPVNRKGAPPSAVETAGNLEKPPSGQKAPLQLKISPELRREVKTYAAERDLEVSTLFRMVWEYYRQNHG